MLYLVGGASRAGKSRLSRRLLEEKRVSYLSADVLMMGLANGVPGFGINPAASSIVRGEQMWPLLRAISVNLLETGVTYLLEGDMLLPRHVGGLAREYGPLVRACFIGYLDVVPEEKLRDIRTFGGEANDWVRACPDEAVLALIAEMKNFSRYLKQECAAHGLVYFDGSHDFIGALEGAYRYLAVV